jgi:hypothetical protein
VPATDPASITGPGAQGEGGYSVAVGGLERSRNPGLDRPAGGCQVVFAGPGDGRLVAACGAQEVGPDLIVLEVVPYSDPPARCSRGTSCEEAVPARHHGSQGYSYTREGPQTRFDLADVMEEGAGHYLAPGLVVRQQGRGIAGHAGRVAPVRTGHATPQLEFTRKEPAFGPGFLRAFWTARIERPEEALGEMPEGAEPGGPRRPGC